MESIISLAITSLIILFLGFTKQKRFLKVPLALLGISLAIFFLLRDWNSSRELFYKMVLIDNFSIAFQLVILISTAFVFMLGVNYYKGISFGVSEIYSLMLFSLIGAVVVTMFSNFATLFIGIETMTIPLYVLAGGKKFSLRSNEASFKYFVMGSFASAIFLFGVALIFGVTATFNISEISDYVIKHQQNLPLMFYTGLVMIIFGFLFKVGAVPFHFWVPDVYEGSPTLVTLYMSTTVKIASFAAFLRLFHNGFSQIPDFWQNIIVIASIATLIVGNIGALQQAGVKRMLAYSSISHTGFLLLTFLAFDEKTPSIILFYSIAYALANITAFGVLILVKNSKHAENTFDAFYGLSHKNRSLAAIMLISMLSLAGIPLTAGFIGKFSIFSATLSYSIMVSILAVITAIVGIYYYFKIVLAMYARRVEMPEIPFDIPYGIALWVASALIIILGIIPEFLLNLI